MSFRDWAAENTTFPAEVVEMALAHTIQNQVEAAHRRGDLLDKRRALMQEWADYLDKFKAGSDAVERRGRAEKPGSQESTASSRNISG